MEDRLQILGLILSLVSLAGFYCAYVYGRQTKRFKWSEYYALIAAPLASVVALAYFVGARILILFVVGATVGFFLEYLIGFVYHKTLNERLWTYDRMSIGGYTSILSIPFWGIAAVIFGLVGTLTGI